MPLTKRTSIGVLLATLVAVFAAIWLLARPNESEVYLAALSPYANPSTVLLSNPSTCGIKAGPVEGLPENLLQSFLAANARGVGPISLSALNGHFAVADSAKFLRFAAAGVSPSVLLQGHENVVRLSRVGFNGNRSEALFCAEGRDGALFHVQLQDGHWQLVKLVSVWVS